MSRSIEELAGSAALTRRHSPAWPPRPIRPRSWWSWETPNRSASRITITVALGTSTPTSMTVVETRTCTSPWAKACIVRSFSSGGIRPCSISTRRPASSTSASWGASSSTARNGRAPGWSRAALVRVDPRAHDIRLATLGNLLPHPLPGTVQPPRLGQRRHHGRLHLAPSCRQLDERGGVEVTEDGHRDRSRDRGRCHHEDVRRRACLGVQRRPLLDPEAVLLVDHDQPEVGELHALLEKGVRPDHDAGLPARRLGEGLSPRGSVERAGQQRHPGAALSATEQATLGEVAEHRRDRALVLLGEHLGRREQRRLATGVDHLEHRAQRDHRLARADLALQQPVHRVALAELAGDLLPHAALAVGQREREPLVEPVENATRRARAGVGDGGLDRGPATGEHGLRDERLVVLEPLLGRDLLAPVVGPVDPAQCLVDLDEVLGLTHLRREQLGDVAHEVEGEPDGVLELPGVHAGHGGVERDQVGHLGEVAALPAVHPGGGVGQLPLVV